MTNKDFLEKVARKTGLSANEVKDLSATLIDALLDGVADGDSVTIQGFGSFESREKGSRKIYNPTSKTYIVVPSKITLNFKMGAALKAQIN